MHSLAYIAIGLLIIAAFFGLIVFIQLACERPTLKPVVLFHGLFALSGLGLLISYCYTHHNSGLLATTLILSAAALGGLGLLSFDLRKKPSPKLILCLHPLIAIIGIGMLISHLLFR